VLAKLTLIKRVKKTNVVVINSNQQTEFMPRHNSYAIEVDYSKNCYSCGGFGPWQEIVRIEES